MLANATYFKGFWKYPFNKKDTSSQDFFCQSGETKQVDMMHSEAHTYFGKENSSVVYVEIPYLNEGFSMNILMPKEGADFNECVRNFSENTIEWEKTGKAKVSMPKFSIEANYKGVENVIKEMGVAHLFDPAKKILKDANLYANQIMQSAKIVVDETDTEASAVTLIGVSSGVSTSPYLDIDLNRPFFFTITEKSTGTILFMGKVAQF